MVTLIHRARTAYEYLFSIGELSASRSLHIIFGTLVVLEGLIVYPIFFKNVASVSSYTSNDFVCWPYFPSCGEWYALSSPPYGYSYTGLFSLLFLLLSGALWALLQKRITLAHVLFLLALSIEGLLLFVLTFHIAYAHIYLHFFFALLVVALPYKLHTVRLSAVFLYFIAGLIALYQLSIGSIHTLPLLPSLISRLSIALVLCLELVGAWFLLSQNSRERRGVLIALLLAHFYGSVVFGWHEFEYLICVVPLLLALFWDREEHTSRTMPLACIALLFFSIAGAQFFTFKLMSDSNIFVLRPHLGVTLSNRTASCTGSITIIRTTEVKKTDTKEAVWNNCQCSPYTRAFEAKQICAREKNVKAVTLSMHCTGDFGAPLSFEIPDVCTAPTPSFFGDLGQVLLETKDTQR